MKEHARALVALLFILLLLVTAGTLVLAQTSPSFNLEWHVIGSSGEASSADYRVRGTLGQSLASPPQADGANFAAASGYWVFESDTSVYLPLITH